jgi:branched-chain amino acid transport system permease protein
VNRRALAVAAFVGVGIALWFVPVARSAADFPIFYLIFLYQMFFWIGQATSWNILTGYTGYFSFGQAAFFGVGVYSSAILVARYDMNFFLSIPLAGIVAMLLALLMGFVAFRLRALRGEVFALLTLAVTFVLAALARLSSFIDGGQGRAITLPEYPEFLGEYGDFIFRLGLVMALIAVTTAHGIQHSKFGRGLFAIRDDEDVAEALGAPTFRYKMIVLGLSGLLAGAGGAIHSLQISYVTIEGTFSFAIPLFVILMSTLGGRQHWLGPVIGAAVVFTLQDRLAGGGYGDLSQILLGTVLIVAILFMPEGLYLRIRSRLRVTLLVFGLALVVQYAFGLGGVVISKMVWAMLAVFPVLVVPTRWLSPLPWLGATAPSAEGLPPRPEPVEPVKEKEVRT